jgi:hypothetical protein
VIPPLPEIPKIRLECTHCGADHNVKPCKCGTIYGILFTIFFAAVIFDVVAFVVLRAKGLL